MCLYGGMNGFRVWKTIAAVTLWAMPAAAQTNATTTALKMKQTLGTTGFNIILPADAVLKQQTVSGVNFFFVDGPQFEGNTFAISTRTPDPSPRLVTELDRNLTTLFNTVGGILAGYSNGGMVNLESITITKTADAYLSRTLYSFDRTGNQRVHVTARSYVFGKRMITLIYEDANPSSTDDQSLAEAIMDSISLVRRTF